MKFCESLGGRKKSRDLHIRKISFSGSSVSSGSFSSTSSCATARDDTTPATPASIDPLSCHPVFHAPPRLHNRPFIPLDGRRYQDVSAFCDDSEDDDRSDLPLHHNQRRRRYHTSTTTAQASALSAIALAAADEATPACAPAMPAADDESCFLMHLAPCRPQMPPSRWSESTIATMQTFDDDELDAPPTTAAEAAATLEAVPAVARVPRPGMKHTDSFEHFVKRGGWKRRGIVFHNEDMAGSFAELR